MSADRPVGNPCGANKTDGSGRCANPAGFKTSHVGFGQCHLHGGATPNGVKHGETQRALWLEALALKVDPALRKLDVLMDAESESVALSAVRDVLDRNAVRVDEATADTNVTIVFNMDDLP